MYVLGVVDSGQTVLSHLVSTRPATHSTRMTGDRAAVSPVRDERAPVICSAQG
jgi:hypothetical protein